MLDSETIKKICEAVDDSFDEQVRVTQELVTYPSQRGQEHTAQVFLYDAFKERGLAMDRWDIDVDEIRTHPAAIREACLDDAYLSNHPPTVTYNGFTAEGYMLEEGTAAEACLRKAHARIFEGELSARICPAYLDARVFVLYDDTPALVYGPTSERIHGFDERVELESVRRVTQSVALFMADWCGLNPQ